MIVGIIGGGASGMAAAITAAEDAGNQVHLFERQARVGKKLLATGNGRCNLTNLNADRGGYHGEDSSFVLPALSVFPVEDTLHWFRKLGLLTVSEPSGRVYPYSDQANSVVDVLRFALERPNIRLHTAFEVKKIRCDSEGGFSVQSDEETVHCDKLIVACGGLAGTKLGGSMSGYKILGQLGHRSTRLRPSLVQLKSAWGGIAGLKGIRANCRLQIVKEAETFAESTGEIQFTDYGISGPVVFEVSRDACYGIGRWCAVIDFLPDMQTADLRTLLKQRPEALPAEELLTGILHNRLGKILLRAAGVREMRTCGELTEENFQSICETVKSFELELTEALGMDHAQVTAGGVLTADFDPETMESKRVPGLYACGEVLDVDGDCGGFNLQWAWSSGRLAGRSAGKAK